MSLAINSIPVLCCNVIKCHTVGILEAERRCSAHMALSHGLDKIKSSGALQVIEPPALLKFLFALPPFKNCPVCECSVLFPCSSYRVEVFQMHHTSAVVCCKVGQCLGKVRYSWARAPLVPSLERASYH